MDYKLIVGSALDVLKKGKERSIQCAIASPPYLGLRRYTPGNDAEIGTEKSLAEYVESLVLVYREVRRLLRDDGTCWIVIGDSYNGSGGAGGDYNKGGLREGQPRYPGRNHVAMKPKDLMMVPAEVAIALRNDGWYLRSEIIWAKGNPMPASVKDRPTTSHEYIFLLSKSKKYFYDHVAIMEPLKEATKKRYRTGWNGNRERDYTGGVQNHFDKYLGMSEEEIAAIPGKNKRTVWEVNTKPWKSAHFATFPPNLIRPMILAGTSEKGCCKNCGAPWVRIASRNTESLEVAPSELDRFGTGEHGVHRKVGGQYQKWLDENPIQTVGWEATCNCNAPIVPCFVLDPFAGACTTGVVALQEGRRFIGVDLNPAYIEMGRKRIEKEVYGKNPNGSL